MNAWDQLIKNKGIEATIYVVSSAVYDEYNNLDWDASTITSSTSKCLIFPASSGPTLNKDMEGWGDVEPFNAHFPTNITIPTNTGPDADVVEIQGQRYRVEASDFPTYGRLKRNKVLLRPLPGNNLG